MATSTTKKAAPKRKAPEPEPEEVDVPDEEEDAEPDDDPQGDDGDDEDFSDLFDENDGDEEDEDLLDNIEDDDSEAWVPDEEGEGIEGIVIRRGEIRSDYADNNGDYPMCPTMTLVTKTGDKWRVVAYGLLLRNAMLEQDPEIGDRVAVKYFGKKPQKKNPKKTTRHYQMAVQRRENLSGAWRKMSERATPNAWR